MTDCDLEAERLDTDRSEENGVAESRSAASSKTVRHSTSQLRKTFYVTAFGFAMFSGAYIGSMDLQSSINIEMGLGVMSLMVGSISSILSSMLVLPTLLDFYGPRLMMVVCYVVSGICVLSNVYPTWFTLFPATALTGIAEPASWATSTTLTAFVVKNLPGRHTLIDQSDMISQYLGTLYAARSLGELFGSGISFAVLNAMNQNHETSGNLCDANVSDTESNTTTVDWSMCVANNCQEDYVYDFAESSNDLYQPSWESIYVLIGIYSTMCIGSAVMLCCFLPRIPAKLDNEKQKSKLCEAFRTEIKKTVTHFVSLQNLLIFPSYLYLGLSAGFYASEYYRAYVSCVVGVKYIGLFAVVHGVSMMISSMMASFCAPKVGRISIYLAAVAIDVAFMVTGLLWHPTSSDPLMLYLLSIMNGFGTGLWMPVISTIAYAYFGDEAEIGLCIQCFALYVGLAISYAWSVPLCVFEKLYILLSFLAFSTLTWTGAELRYRRRIKVHTVTQNREEMKNAQISSV